MVHGYLTPSTGFTVEIWFNRAVAPGAGGYPALITQYTQANAVWSTNKSLNGRHLWLGLTPTSGAILLQTYTEAGTININWTDPSPSGYQNDGEWHHIAFTLASNKTTWALYLDGVVKTSGISSYNHDWKPGILAVGDCYAPHIGNFGGFYLWDEKLAMFAAVNKQLSANRIAEHYAAGNGGTVYYGDDEVERLTRILDWTDTPVPCRELDAATSTLQGIEVAGTNALDALLSTASDASGYVFADGQSWIQYHNKRHRYNRHSLFTFAESTGSAVEAGIEFVVDDEKIYNDIRGSRPYGGSYRMTDNTSVDEFGRRTYEFSLSITSAEELRNAVAWLLSRYGTAHVRISGVSLRAETSSIIEAAATGGLEIGDHLVIDELPEWAPVERAEFTVEGMSLEANFVEQTWVLDLNLTPAEFDAVFQIGVSTLGGTDKVAL